MKFSSSLNLLVFILFLAGGLVTAYFSSEPSRASDVGSRISKRLKGELQKAWADIDLAIATSDSFPDPGNFSYPIFYYHRGELVYWSDNNFVPTLQQAADTFETKLFTTVSEAYLILKKKAAGGRWYVSIIPLLRKYPISNDYLSPEYNDKILPSSNVTILDVNATLGVEICDERKCYFRVSILPEDTARYNGMRSLALIVLIVALVFFIRLIYQYVPYVCRRSTELALVYLTVVFWIVRYVMTETGFPGDFIKGDLFDPQVFASSSLNASLGDLFLNLLAVLALCFFVFRNYFRFSFIGYVRHRVFSWVIAVTAVLCILFATLFPVVVMQTLYNNSVIALDISQSLKFDPLRIVAIVSVLVSGICAFLFSHAFLRILMTCAGRFKTVIAFLIAATIFAVVNEYNHQQYISSLIISVIYVTVIFIWGVSRSLQQLTFHTFAYLFIAIVFLSMNAALAVQSFTFKEKIENQFRFASNFLIDRDIFGEYLLHETSQKIAKDVFTQTRITNPFLSKEAIRQKIRQVFLPSYFNKYDVDIMLFNSQGDPLDENASTLSDFVLKYDKDTYKTGYQGIYFINQELDIAQKYLMVIPIARGAATSGYVVIQLSLKKIIPQSVYPELLVDFRIQQFYRTQDLSYAVFANKSMVFHSGEYNYDKFFNMRWLGNPDLYTVGLSDAGYDHIAVEDQSGRVAVVSTRQMPFTHKLSNFSFFLVLGLLIILVMIFIQGVYQYFRGSRLFFSARIQLYLNLAFFIPLIIVSVTTLSLTSRSSQQQLNDEYLNKSRIFSNQMVNLLDDIENQNVTMVLSERLNDLAKLSDLDANIYYPDGRLMASSQPLIFESNLISEYINARAYIRVINGDNFFIESERVGALQYFVSYAVLKSPVTGELVGILGIPFFQSAYLLERVQSVIIINILNIFAFIFIVLLLLSYIVADRLTFPLRFITQSLRRTSLTKSNTPLTWGANDEIGLMVKEYNAMLYKLSESKSELEQTQREKAWREIAQQVAHEIKNPLTPMKLTLQQLERALQSGSNTNEKTSRAISTLLGQVDTLNDIASSFSGFVKMPEPVIQPLEIVSAVKRTVDLHSPTGEIVFRAVVKDAWVMGDAQLLSRTFSNIILNALQSERPGENTQVTVVVQSKEGICHIEFKDNGRGIDPEIADRVFIPHFSTKKSGSGLGLAIAKQAIEQMNGKIWFETALGQGTTFHIELPLMR